MTDPAEKTTLPPFRLAVAAGTAALCSAIIYNAVAGQDGRQRDVLSRLSDLEHHETLPVTIGAGAFDARPTTKAMVTIEELAELVANEGSGTLWPANSSASLRRLGLYQDRSGGRTVRRSGRPSKPTSALTKWR
jgi:hypothetical protein